MLRAEVEDLTGLVDVEIRNRPVANFAAGDQLGAGGDREFQRSFGIGGMEIEEVQVVGAQALEAALAFAQQMGAAQPAVFGPGADGVAGLGGQHGALSPPAQRQAYIFLRHAAGRAQGAGIAFVHIGGVDKVDSEVQGSVDDGASLSFTHGGAEGHSAQTEGRDPEIGAGDGTQFHVQCAPAQRTPRVISFCIPGRVKVSGPWPRAV